MDGGKLAAQFLLEALAHGNYDKEVMSIWHDRWMARFGNDFKWSVGQFITDLVLKYT